MSCSVRNLVCLVTLFCPVIFCPVIFCGAFADETRDVNSETLRNDQLAISGRYDRFERLLSQMSDVLGHEDPERAELLRQAISKGREKAISGQLGRIAENLKENELGLALEHQEEVLESLAMLLQLLQSEDRRSELEQERERLNNLLKDVSNTLSQQRSARASTQNSTAPSSSAPNQQKAINQADRVLDDIKDYEGSSSEETDAQDSESNSDKSDEQQESNSESGENKSSENDKDSKPDESGQDETQPGQFPSTEPGEQSDSESQSSESQQNAGPGESGESEAKKTPGGKEVAQARQYMQEALEQLQKQLRDQALEKQDDAIEELQKAVEELRRKLLQLREEEKEMILASLEARFQRMLAQQTQI